jgi:hypothetical protein
MAIFGAGSAWEGTDEQRDNFFNNGIYLIGWEYASASDVYLALASLKPGDIIYLKSNAPGSRTIRVKGVGIVLHSLSQLLFDHLFFQEDINPEALSINVRWIWREEFYIQIPESDGRLTNVRAATFYEAYLPYVQQEILTRIFSLVT